MSSKPLRRLQRLAAVIAVLGGAVLASAGQTMPDGRPTPSGQPVPRWLSLKSSEVRARYGPGLDYRILWEYRASGLPVQVIAETREWRKICDADGSVAWVHRSVVSSRRSVFNASAAEIAVHAGRSAASPVRARLAPRSIVSLDDCEEGWCRVGARKLRGWVAQGSVFGAQTRTLCDASRPAGPRP